jgi:hypothetical protein
MKPTQGNNVAKPKARSNAPLWGSLIGAGVGGTGMYLATKGHVDNPDQWMALGAIIGGGLGLLIGLSWKSMHRSP